MAVLAIASTQSDKYSKSSSSSLMRAVQTKDSEKYDMWKFSKIATSFVGGYMNSPQKHFEKFSISETASIPLIERSLRQIDFLPKILTRNDVENILREFEKKYSISSEEFYSKWRRGQVVDSLDSLKWATIYETFKEGYII